MAKKKTSFTLSEEAMRLLSSLAGKYTISKTAIVEVAIRRMAREEGIEG